MGRESFDVRSIPTKDREKILMGVQHQYAVHVAVQRSKKCETRFPELLLYV